MTTLLRRKSSVDPLCNGICLTASEVGLSGYPGQIAYPHPECELHSDVGEKCSVVERVKSLLSRLWFRVASLWRTSEEPWG